MMQLNLSQQGARLKRTLVIFMLSRQEFERWGVEMATARSADNLSAWSRDLYDRALAEWERTNRDAPR